MKYNPSDAAKTCNVSVNTVRGWIRDFGEHFTTEARGESGNRLLSDKDLNTLKYIASLRSNGLQRDAIAQRLQETSIGEAETLQDLGHGLNGDCLPYGGDGKTTLSKLLKSNGRGKPTAECGSA